MKRIITLDGVTLPDATALPTIERTPAGRAMGGIPGWRAFLDPAHADGASVRNRAMPNSTFDAGGPFSYAEIAGEPAFDASSSGPRFMSTVEMNPDAWSAFFIIQAPATGATGGRELLRPNSIDDPGVVPRVTIRTSGQFSVIEAESGNIRLDGPAIPDDVRCLLMATSSIRDGLHLYIDGEEVASNPDDKRPLDSRYGAGEYSVLRGTSADLPLRLGMSGILDIDLGWPEHRGYRRAIEKFLMGKYSIS